MTQAALKIIAAHYLLVMLRRLATSQTLYLMVGVVLVGFLLTRWVDALGGPEGVWERFGLAAPVVTVPLHALVAVSPFPSDLVSMANGAVYGFWAGALLSWMGWFLASFIQYGIGWRVRKDFDVAGWVARSPVRLRHFPVGHPAFLIGARYVPYAGGHLATIFPGAMGVDLGRFAWCTAVALVPQSLLMAGIGAGLSLF